MAATLRLRRDGVGIELRSGGFDVTVDGDMVGSIEKEGMLEVALGPGHHTLRASAGRYSSYQRSFEAADGDIADFSPFSPSSPFSPFSVQSAFLVAL